MTSARIRIPIRMLMMMIQIGIPPKVSLDTWIITCRTHTSAREAPFRLAAERWRLKRPRLTVRWPPLSSNSRGFLTLRLAFTTMWRLENSPCGKKKAVLSVLLPHAADRGRAEPGSP